MHTMANGTRSGISTHKSSRHSRGSVATMVKSPVAGPRAAAAAGAMIKTPAPAAMGHTPMEMSDSGIHLGALMAITRAGKPSRRVIAMTIRMGRNPWAKVPAYSMSVVILPVWIPKEGYWRIQIDSCVWLWQLIGTNTESYLQYRAMG